MTNTIDLYKLQRLLDSKDESIEQNRLKLEKFLESPDSNCLLNKVFAGIDPKLFEGLTREENEILNDIIVRTKFFGKVMEIQKKDLEEKLEQDAKKHSINLYNILREESEDKEKDQRVTKELYAESVKDLVLMMNAKHCKINVKEEETLEELIMDLRGDLEKLNQRVLKRHQVEEKEAKAVADVYANIGNYLTRVFCLFILCIFLLWTYAATDAFL